jgi:hypothetical protein
MLVKRDGFTVVADRTVDGACPACGRASGIVSR